MTARPLVVLSVVILVGPAATRAEEILRLSAFGTAADTDLAGHVNQRFNFGHGMIFDIDERIALDGDESMGVALAWEHRWPRLGLTLSLARSDIDLPYEWRQEQTPVFEGGTASERSLAGDFARVELLPLLLDVSRVWALGERLDGWLGGTVGYVFADVDSRVQVGEFGTSFLPLEANDAGPTAPVNVSIDDEVAFGVVLGLDLRRERGLGPRRVRRTLEPRPGAGVRAGRRVAALRPSADFRRSGGSSLR